MYMFLIKRPGLMLKSTAEHTTLNSPVSSKRDKKKLREAGAQLEQTWIGLYRDPDDTDWRWSGGGYASYMPWVDGEPNNANEVEYYGSICWSCEPTGWNDLPESMLQEFFCLSLIVVKEKKTWEEALQHCREQHTDLTSLVSETEVLLAQREIWEAQTTEHVWTGLRYLADRWLWVNGDPLEYQAWSQGEQQQCPAWSQRCGAVSKEGEWESRDCQERLHFICD
ncbi:snaclec purpureotin subunit beta-like [Centroberyx gerrardi]